eukprot:6208226-Pleurochrysis_carterae.AAC.3
MLCAAVRRTATLNRVQFDPEGEPSALDLFAAACGSKFLTEALPRERRRTRIGWAPSARAASARLISRYGISKNSMARSEKSPSEIRSGGVVVKCLRVDATADAENADSERISKRQRDKDMRTRERMRVR